MASKPQSKLLHTPVCRVSYPAFFTARSMRNPDGTESKPRFGGTFIFDKRGMELTAKIGVNFGALIGDIVKEVNLFANARWPDEFKEAKQPFLRDSKLKSPWLDPKDPKYRDRPEMKDATTFIRPTSQRKIKVIDRKGNEILDEEEVYPGSYARAILAVFTYSNTGNHGPGFGLRGVQFVAEGERLDGGVDVSDAFGALDDPDEDAFGASETQGSEDQSAALAAMFAGG